MHIGADAPKLHNGYHQLRNGFYILHIYSSLTNSGGHVAVIQSNLFHVVKRFPDRKDTIKRLYKENKNFKTICEDYRKCLEAYQHWNESGSKDASARREEYATLLGELETEIIQSMAESNTI